MAFTTGIFAQNSNPYQTVISPVKMNILYIGVDNPLDIAVSSVPIEKISATISQGTLTKVAEGEFVAKPTTPGIATVEVSAEIDGEIRKIAMMAFRVKKIPVPTVKVAGKAGGKIDKNDLMSAISVFTMLEDFPIDVRYPVTEFTVTASIEGVLHHNSTKGNRITDSQKELIGGLTKGQSVYFENIKTKCPDDSIVDLPAVVFIID